MSQLSPERRKVVILGGAIAAMSASTAALQHKHPWLTAIWLCLLLVALVYVIVQLFKIRRSEQCSRKQRNNAENGDHP